MVKSNVISISVSEVNEVKTNTLSVDKTSGYLGDTFHFSGRVTGSINPDYYLVKVDIYINNTLQDTITLSPTSSSFDETYSFDFTPQNVGSYSVYTDAYIAPKGGRI